MSRVALAVVAVLVLGWLGIMERDAHLAAKGKDMLAGKPSPATLRTAERDLRDARLLNPDTEPTSDLVLALQAQGRLRAATAQAKELLRDEPDNLEVWGVLDLLSRYRSGDVRSRAQNRAQAAAAAHRLDPLRYPRALPAAP